MTAADELRSLHSTWDHVAAQRPYDVPEAAYRLWLTAHALVNQRIPIEQAAYLHAEANLTASHRTVDYAWPKLAEEYDRTRAALQEIADRPQMLHHLWLALHGWGQYDPTPDARAANSKAKIDRYRQETILARMLRGWMKERLRAR